MARGKVLPRRTLAPGTGVPPGVYAEAHRARQRALEAVVFHRRLLGGFGGLRPLAADLSRRPLHRFVGLLGSGPHGPGGAVNQAGAASPSVSVADSIDRVVELACEHDRDSAIGTPRT
ncbi:hypothetical protein ABZ468_14965 [Streptomyces sp. NPDC005708]|uniref:hypothetical protein n=1 Tax=Streptomyces sp. NPDC005708 TaxID=3154564 RepID=UPI0034066CBC